MSPSEGVSVEGVQQFCLSETEARGNRLASIRDLDAKLIRAEQIAQERIAPLEYYDLVSDRMERENLAGSNDPRERELLTRLLEETEDSDVEPPAPQQLEFPPHLRSQLKALGYLD